MARARIGAVTALTTELSHEQHNMRAHLLTHVQSVERAISEVETERARLGVG